MLAPRLGYAVVGQPARFTGLLTVVAALGVGAAVSMMSGVKPAATLFVSYSWLSIPIAAYVYIQAIGHDPYEWVTTSFGPPVFGTIGNPNTASGFLAVCAVMSMWVVSQGDIRRNWRLVSGVALGMAVGAMPLLVSFQGQIVVSLAGFLWIVRTVLLTSFRTWLFWVEMSVGMVIMAVPFFPSRSWVLPLSTGATFILIAVSIEVARRSHVGEAGDLRNQRRFSVACFVVLAAITLWSPLRSLLTSGLADGLIERGDFYRAAGGVFKAHPILGGGFENFGFHFTTFRPEGHAIRLENSRPSSVHSVPLAMFASGGVILGLAYLAFVLLIAWRIFSVARKSSLLDPKVFWLAALWLCINVQSLVSVEHVSLYLQFFVVAGIIEAVAQGEKRAPERRRRRSATKSNWVDVAFAFVATVLLAIPLTRPFRANSLALDATVELLSGGDRSQAIRSYEKVVEMAPWDFYYKYELGFMVFQSGDGERGANLLLESAEESNYLASLAVPAATALAQVSRLEDAAQVLLRAVDRDPYAPTLRRQSADFLTQMGDAFADVQDKENAELFYRRALRLLPDFPPAVEGLQSVA